MTRKNFKEKQWKISLWSHNRSSQQETQEPKIHNPPNTFTHQNPDKGNVSVCLGTIVYVCDCIHYNPCIYTTVGSMNYVYKGQSGKK